MGLLYTGWRVSTKRHDCLPRIESKCLQLRELVDATVGRVGSWGLELSSPKLGPPVKGLTMLNLGTSLGRMINIKTQHGHIYTRPQEKIQVPKMPAEVGSHLRGIKDFDAPHMM